MFVCQVQSFRQTNILIAIWVSLGLLGPKATKIEAKLVFVCQVERFRQTNILMAIWVSLGLLGPKAPKIEAKLVFVCQAQILGKQMY